MNPAVDIRTQVAVIGGGVAGLWTLRELIRRGHDGLLIESDALGRGQTIASQGIIHGGLKYTLDGVFRDSAAAIRDMPGVWRACLDGRGEPNLADVARRGEFCYLWRIGTWKSWAGMLGARASLRSNTEVVEEQYAPTALRCAPGGLFRVDEQVIEPESLIRELAGPVYDRLMHARVVSASCEDRSGGAVTLELKHPETGRAAWLQANQVVLSAGAGNAALRRLFGFGEDRMQRRPLHMLLARGRLHPIQGHCIDGARTRVTITSTTDAGGRIVWQIGGQVSEDGVDMSPRKLIRHGVSELQAVLRDFSTAGVEWSTYRVDRAELASGGLRPDDATVLVDGPVLTAWPTKLVLAPRLARRVAEMVVAGERLAGDAVESGDVISDWPRPPVATPPWKELDRSWFSDPSAAPDSL